MKMLTILASLLMSSSLFAEDIYMLKTKIGENTFNDVFVYSGCMGTTFEGSLTVPGVFTAKAEQTACRFLWSGGESVSFKILVRENNKEYYVNYGLKMTNNYVGGVMRQNGEIIGTIEGTLIYSSEQ